MDLGCFDQCIDVFIDPEKKKGEKREESKTATVKIGKSNASKESCHSILNSVNKCALQIKKPPHRKSGSPLNWFPRKKTDSFLKRKIKLLQEVGGMSSSLDEILGDSNPHYSRVEREKIAAREAARKAMEARKAAMVEASWCKILQAARIPSKEAEFLLVKAEKAVAEAFQEAAAMGVIMYDRPDCPRQPCEIETSSNTGGRSIHTVTATFETAFEVDKEVAAAVKTAFIQLAHDPTSSNKDEFKDLLWKINQHPDTNETKQALLELSSESEPEAGTEPQSEKDAVDVSHSEVSNRENPENKCKNRPLSTNYIAKKSNISTNLVVIMLERLRHLQEDELSSLATIVATCGLNAALHEVENSNQHGSGSGCILDSAAPFTRRMSSLGAGSVRDSNKASLVDGQLKRKQAATELPSLDKFLVKHVSRLEREVQEAKQTRKNDVGEEREKTVEWISNSKDADSNKNKLLSMDHPDLGSILVKHTSRLEKEIEEEKKSQNSIGKDTRSLGDEQEAELLNIDKENVDLNQPMCQTRKAEGMIDATLVHYVKEKVDTSQVAGDHIVRRSPSAVKHMSRIERAKLEALEAFSVRNDKEADGDNGLDKILVKPVHRLEREKIQALMSRNDSVIPRLQKREGVEVTASESLDKVLVKHVSRLEREKMAALETKEVVVKQKEPPQFASGKGLDEIFVRRPSRLEKEKLAAAQQPVDVMKHAETRREAREREMREAWGGLSLGNSIKPHLSRLERDKAAWVRAEEEERRRANGTVDLI